MAVYLNCSIEGCGEKAKWNVKAGTGEQIFRGICSEHMLSLKEKFAKEGYNVWPEKMLVLSDALPPTELVSKLKQELYNEKPPQRVPRRHFA
jgi:hypothetical protein